MNLRQIECDSKSAKTSAHDSVVTAAGQMTSSFGDHSTRFDVDTRIVALPAYLLLNIEQFDL